MFSYSDEWFQSPVKYSLYTGLEKVAQRFVYGFKSLLVVVYSRSVSFRWIEHINEAIKDGFILLLNTDPCPAAHLQYELPLIYFSNL